MSRKKIFIILLVVFFYVSLMTCLGCRTSGEGDDASNDAVVQEIIEEVLGSSDVDVTSDEFIPIRKEGDSTPDVVEVEATDTTTTTTITTTTTTTEE
ncbi:hypothetical protein D4R87_02210, partial [bacterium]